MLKLTSLVTALSLVFLLSVAPATGQNRNLNADLPISTWQAPAFWDASSAHRDPLDRERLQAARPTPEAASGTPLSNSMAFVAIVPCRLVDTRSATGDSFGSPAMNASETRTIPVLSNTRCNIPSTAQAYSLNFTVVPTGSLSFLTAWPTGNPPSPMVSILNDVLGTLLANAAVVPAGTSGSIDVYVTDTTQVIIDVNGYYAPQISLANGTAAAPSLTFAGDNTSGIYSSGAGTVSVATAGANRLTVAANGNVGIGTTTPGSTLDVAGDINLSGQIRTSLGSSTLLGYDAFFNVAVGPGAGRGGTANTALGFSALAFANSTGSHNTAVGTAALQSNTNGSNNIAIGQFAAVSVSGGNSNNIHIGNYGASADNNTIRIGVGPNSNGFTPHTSFFAAGVAGATVSGAQVLVDTTTGQLGVASSSRRFKDDIQDMGDASRGLMHLRPVTFRYKKPYADGTKPVQYGLIAEEVAEVYPDLVARSADGQIETVKYQVLDSMLLNEVQRQQGEISSQKGQIRGLEQQNQDLQRRLARLEAALVSASGEPRLPQ